MPIYTRTGDKGKTSLFDGTRVLKSHKRVETYGTIDELNSNIGVVIAEIKELYSSSEQSESRRDFGQARMTSARQARTINIVDELEKIQHDLLDIGSTLATPHPMPVEGLENRPYEFEQLIDNLTNQLPELKEFILPGGGKVGAFLHICRTIARRAERQLVALLQKEAVDKSIVTYLNRLSDLLFTMARYVNYVEKKKEMRWIKK